MQVLRLTPEGHVVPTSLIHLHELQLLTCINTLTLKEQSVGSLHLA